MVNPKTQDCSVSSLTDHFLQADGVDVGNVATNRLDEPVAQRKSLFKNERNHREEMKVP